MSGRPEVAVGVPVWRGAYVAETLSSILAQTDVDLRVEVWLDGKEAQDEASCRPFLADPRVRLAGSPTRRGWVVSAASALGAAAATGASFVAIQPHDDLLEPGYLRALLELARTEPRAAVTYCDIAGFGLHDVTLRQEAVTGSPVRRQLIMLLARYNGIAWRGLTRTEMLRAVPPMEGNAMDDFAADTVWMARLARVGDLLRAPQALYRKRYHPENTHTKWPDRPIEEKVSAWLVHCRAMLAEALAVAETADDRGQLMTAARDRLVGKTGLGPFANELRALDAAAKSALLDRFDRA